MRLFFFLTNNNRVCACAIIKRTFENEYFQTNVYKSRDLCCAIDNWLKKSCHRCLLHSKPRVKQPIAAATIYLKTHWRLSFNWVSVTRVMVVVVVVDTSVSVVWWHIQNYKMNEMSSRQTQKNKTCLSFVYSLVRCSNTQKITFLFVCTYKSFFPLIFYECSCIWHNFA